ncbi:MAG: RNA polymerase factor sigma-54 [Pseudomonadota bacterium]
MTKQYLTTDIRQTLNLTASMQQSINILQMSSIELQEFIVRELDKNPFLETDEATTDQASGEKAQDERDIFSSIKEEKSLKQHVLEQVHLDIETAPERALAVYMTDLLQPSGYITLDEEELASRLKCSRDDIITVLGMLQSIEPVGIFARNLGECLALQLKDKGLYDSKYEALLTNLDLLAKHEHKALAKICSVSHEEIIKMIGQIKALNPKPGASFASEATNYKSPDVFLTISDDGEMKVEINYEAMPRLRINKDYYIKIKEGLNGEIDKEFASKELASAGNLLRAVEQRAKTIVNVAAAIAEKQRDFFLKGIMYFKPMTLATIAAVCDMNESTISRATSYKYISTPSGLFEMKFFFSSSVENKNSDADVSSTKVKELIKTLISSEDKDNILSDDDIARELLKFNIKAARRTVSKYRESMRIPTSATRKRAART